MAGIQRLTHVLSLLQSNRVLERRKACEALLDELSNENTVKDLKESDEFMWGTILTSIQSCLLKDNEKMNDDLRKKGPDSCKTMTTLSADLYSVFLRLATRERGVGMEFTKPLKFMLQILNTGLGRKLYDKTFLKTIIDCFLSNAKVRGLLPASYWQQLFKFIKNASSQTKPNGDYLKCTFLLLKWSTKYNAGRFFQNEFEFLGTLCKTVSGRSARADKEIVLDVAFEFCKQMAYDNRLGCALFGEEVLPVFLEMYDIRLENVSIRRQTLNFFALQLALHNPEGCTRQDPASYAHNWTCWRNCLLHMFHFLNDEVAANFSDGEEVLQSSVLFADDNTTEISASFMSLYVDVFRQLWDGSDRAALDSQSSSSDSPPNKKRRIDDFNFNYLMGLIGSKSWAWIAITCTFIKTYPALITNQDLVEITRMLNSFLGENNVNPNLLNHIFRGLIIVDEIQEERNAQNVTEFDQKILWSNVAKFALRSINNVFKNDENLHILIRRLISKRAINWESLYQHYRTSDVNITEPNLKTLNWAFNNFALVENKVVKTDLLVWILDENRLKVYPLEIENALAKFLVYLTLKRWPGENLLPLDLTDCYDKDRKSLELALQITALEKLITVDKEACKITSAQSKAEFRIEVEVLNVLIDSLHRFITSVSTENVKNDDTQLVELNFRKCALTLKVLSHLLTLDLLEEKCLERVFEVFETICKTILIDSYEVFVTVNKFTSNSNKVKRAEKLMTLNRLLENLFHAGLNPVIGGKLKSGVPVDLLKSMFGILKIEQEERKMKSSDDSDRLLEVKKSVIRTLMKFCCVSQSAEVLPMQQRASECLFATGYNHVDDNDHQLVMTLLEVLPNCESCQWSEYILMMTYTLIQAMAANRSHCVVSVESILSLFYKLYPVVVFSKQQQVQTQFIELLYQFYEKRADYGPSVSVLLLDCMCQFYELESDFGVLRWTGCEICMKFAEFLTSDYQEVRLAAVRKIATFFQLSSRNYDADQFHRQSQLFAKICETSEELFQLDDDLNESRIIDETVTRSASVLQTFASIITTSRIWMEDALYAMIEVARRRNLVENLKRILEAISSHLGYKGRIDFLLNFLEKLLPKWHTNNGIDDFHYDLFNCQSKLDLYETHWPILASFIVECDRVSLTELAGRIGKTLPDLLKEWSPELLARSLAKSVLDKVPFEETDLYKYLHRNGIRRSEIEEILKSQIDRILLNLLKLLLDNQELANQYGEVIYLKKNGPRLTVAEFQRAIDTLQEILGLEDLLVNLLENHPHKVHEILLGIKIRIHRSSYEEEKMVHFHSYTVISSLLLDKLRSVEKLQESFLRDLFYTLSHFIDLHTERPKLLKLSLCAVKYLKIVLTPILREFTGVVGDLLLVIVTILKKLARDSRDGAIGEISADILKSLETVHGGIVSHQIYKYCFPSSSLNVTRSIETEGNFELEITNFLKFVRHVENEDDCEDGLKYLMTLLRSHKGELKCLLERLRVSNKTFAEGGETITFRQLICTLVKLSLGSNETVSSGAICCLGEIGPVDLASLVLVPEKTTVDSKWSPWEIISGNVVAMLCQYIVDPDINLAKTASDALVHVFRTREGIKIIDSHEDFGSGRLNEKLLLPFLPSPPNQQPALESKIDADLFESRINSDDLWIAVDKSDHGNWIGTLVTTILSCFGTKKYFQCLIEICNFKVDFCEKLLPLLIYAILHTTNRKSAICQILSSKIGGFFEEHWNIVNRGGSNNGNVPSLRKSVRCMLDVVQFCRLQRSSKSKRADDEDLLKLNYLHVAKAAQSCQMYFTALLYVELWCNEEIKQNPEIRSESRTNCSLLDRIYQTLDETSAKSLHAILLQSYESIGESDAFSGCGTNFLHDRTFRFQYYKHLNRWDEVVRHHEDQLSMDRPDALRPLVDALRHSNLHEVASLISSTGEREPDYESLWRLGRWSQDGGRDDRQDGGRDDFEKYRYFALKALKDDEECAYSRALDRMRSSVLGRLRHVNLQSTRSFNNCMANIRALREIQEFYEGVVATVTDGDDDEEGRDRIFSVLDKWKAQDGMTCNDVEFVESIKSQRIVMLDGLLDGGETVRRVLVDMMLEFCEYSRLEGNSQSAYRCMSKLIRMSAHLDDDDLKTRIEIEDAQLCWAKGDALTAKCILRQVAARRNVDPKLSAQVLRTTGKWLAEDSSENRRVIIKEYFLASLRCSEGAERSHSRADSYVQLARFADRNYQQVQAHIKSDLFQKKLRNMEKSKQTVEAALRGGRRSSGGAHRDKDWERAIGIKKRQRTCDQLELMNVQTEKTELLTIALKYYIKSLIWSDLDNINIFRTFALFLENNRDPNGPVEEMLRSDYPKIPSHKFIAVLPQVIPHILADGSGASDAFSRTTGKIVEKCAEDHPHHTLPLLLALANAEKDRVYTGGKSKKADGDDRAAGARSLLDRLKSCDSLKETVREMEAISEALIELAYYEMAGKEGVEIRIPARCKIHKVKDFRNVLLPTVTLAVSKSCDYRDVIGIHSFDGGFYNVGGINAPKRIICRGTDGIKRTQLVKGQDDLRQDAVMQQVFTVINGLLAANEQTRDLRIRTYKIVPLSKRSGILEWVNNTLPIGEYLTGKNRVAGAHEIYNPNDYTANRCREDMKKVQQLKEVSSKLKKYNEICRHFRPVFHKFFECGFPSPTIWYERRRAYIHSVATTSMCGYVLGIGDRHVNNILIDKGTAEVVHIDFGIAFEQGQVLPTPETVPFRLTRDLVDGMGIAGVEGLFRRSCEKTVQLLRTHSQPIITILEVLLYDPLYDWTVSVAEANKRQHVTCQGEESLQMSDENSSDINVTAERALLRLRAKLQGTENGTPSTIQHQVGTLIQQAIDPMNLCCVYNGWQPYL